MEQKHSSCLLRDETIKHLTFVQMFITLARTLNGDLARELVGDNSSTLIRDATK